MLQEFSSDNFAHSCVKHIYTDINLEYADHNLFNRLLV